MGFLLLKITNPAEGTEGNTKTSGKMPYNNCLKGKICAGTYIYGLRIFLANIEPGNKFGRDINGGKLHRLGTVQYITFSMHKM